MRKNTDLIFDSTGVEKMKLAELEYFQSREKPTEEMKHKFAMAVLADERLMANAGVILAIIILKYDSEVGYAEIPIKDFVNLTAISHATVVRNILARLEGCGYVTPLRFKSDTNHKRRFAVNWDNTQALENLENRVSGEHVVAMRAALNS